MIGVEAAPQKVELTKSFLEVGGLSKLQNTIIRNCAVGDRDGVTKFHFVKSEPGLSSIVNRDVSKGYDVEVIDCNLTTIDELLKKVNRTVNFAKFDIEGGEYHAFLGAERIFTKDRPPIVFEFNPDAPNEFAYNAQGFLDIFDRYGYKITDFFGLQYDSLSDFQQGQVWNYFAAPKQEFEKFKVTEIIRYSSVKYVIYSIV